MSKAYRYALELVESAFLRGQNSFYRKLHPVERLGYLSGRLGFYGILALLLIVPASADSRPGDEEFWILSGLRDQTAIFLAGSHEPLEVQVTPTVQEKLRTQGPGSLWMPIGDAHPPKDFLNRGRVPEFEAALQALRRFEQLHRNNNWRGLWNLHSPSTRRTTDLRTVEGFWSTHPFCADRDEVAFLALTGDKMVLEVKCYQSSFEDYVVMGGNEWFTYRVILERVGGLWMVEAIILQ